MNILILGSNSHIAKGLIHYYEQDENVKLFKWNRNGNEKYPLRLIDVPSNIKLKNYDMIINCIGKSYEFSFSDIRLYNYYDDDIIYYLECNKDCLYVNMSSWIVTQDIKEDDIKYKYWLNKKYLELKHRLLPELNIIDLRIPGYFSRWIDLDSGFLMAEILKAKLTCDYSKLYFDKNELLYYLTPRHLINIIWDMYKIKGNKHINLIDRIAPEIKRNIFINYVPEFKNIYTKGYKKRKINVDLENEYQEWLKLTATPEEESACEKGLGQ